MSVDSLIIDLTLIMMSAAAVTLIFRKLKQPVVLGYILAGFLISPNFKFFPTVIGSEDIVVWAEIGVIFLMFGLGLEFSFKKLANIGGSAFIIAVTVMGAMVFIGTGAGWLFGWKQMDCLFLGCMLSMSSTMIILKAYEEFNAKNEKYAQVVLGTLVIEDIAGIFMMIVLTALSVGKDVSGFELIQELGFMMILLAIWMMAGVFLIPSFLNKTTKIMSDEMLLVFSIGLCLGMVLIAHAIGFSAALGAFMTGSILAGTVYGDRIERIITPIKDMFGAVFFISVGMLIVPSLLVKYIVPILILSVVTILGQSTFACIGILLSGQTLKTAVKGGMSMVQIGEFSFIVATLGTSLGVISEHLYPIVVCISVITSFVTPSIMKSSDKVYQWIMKVLPRRIRINLSKMTSDKQREDDKDKDWPNYIKGVFGRIFICSACMLLIYEAGTAYLYPMLVRNIGGWADITGAVIMLLAMIPFTRMMHDSAKDALFTKLWLKSRFNRLPLIALRAFRIFIAACFMALVVRSMFHVPFPILVIVAVIPVILIIRSDLIKGMAIEIELRFMSNFFQKTLASEKRERGVNGNLRMIDESLFVSEFQIVGLDAVERVMDFSSRRGFHGTIIKIVREDGTIINMPDVDCEIMKNDYIHIMGTKEEIDAIIILLEREKTIEYTERPDITLKDYIYGQTFRGIHVDKQLFCIPIKVDSTMDFCRKPIKYSNVRENYGGSIIGIERVNLPIIRPNVATIIQENDLMWVLGTKSSADKMIKAGIMEKHKKEKKNAGSSKTA